MSRRAGKVEAPRDRGAALKALVRVVPLELGLVGLGPRLRRVLRLGSGLLGPETALSLTPMRRMQGLVGRQRRCSRTAVRVVASTSVVPTVAVAVPVSLTALPPVFAGRSGQGLHVRLAEEVARRAVVATVVVVGVVRVAGEDMASRAATVASSGPGRRISEMKMTRFNTKSK